MKRAIDETTVVMFAVKISSKPGRVLVVSLLGLLTITVAVWWQRTSNQAGSISAQAQALKDISLSTLDVSSLGILRPELSGALGITGSAVFQERIDLLTSVSGDLSSGECAALLHALLEPRGVNDPAGWHAEYLHNIARLLQGAMPVEEDFARALATLARDRRSDETVRDYALQHLRQVWERADSEGRDAIAATFRELAREDSGVADSALLSLHLLGKPVSPELEDPTVPATGNRSSAGFHVPDSELEPLLSRILKSAPSANAIRPRLTALRIVGDRQLKNFREDLRGIASDTGREHALVRMAAIANLGSLADPSDRPLLESLALSRDTRVKQAARRALALNR